MDIQNDTTEHRKGQHLLAEERHEMEVRLKDGWPPYRIARHLGRAYNTTKNEIARGTVSPVRSHTSLTVLYLFIVGIPRPQYRVFSENASR